MSSWHELWTIWPTDTTFPSGPTFCYGNLQEWVTKLTNSSPWPKVFGERLVGTAAKVDEQRISDEEMSDLDPQEAYTAVKFVVLIPRQAADQAKENPKVAQLKERLIEAHPRLFSGVANKNSPDCGKFGTAKIKLKPKPKHLSSPDIPTPRRTSGSHEKALDGIF